MFWTILIIVVIIVLFLGLLIWFVGERGKLSLPSTLEFIREGGLKRFLSLSTLHGYLYLRWQKPYLKLFINKIGPNSTQSARKWWSDQYHGKILPEKEAENLVRIHESISLRELEQVVPYPIARDLVISAPPKITVYECGCRHARKDHCSPTQVCMFFGEPFANFMLEHHPNESRALSQPEALELLQAEHQRGHVHTAWFKNAMHDRFYVICNCCKCCCGGIETMNKYGIPMMASSGYVAIIDEDLCGACGTCVENCPFEAISLEEHAVISWEKCMGCGVCVDPCPNAALSLIIDENKGIPLDLPVLLKTDRV